MVDAAKVLDYHDVLLRQADVDTLQGWLGDQVVIQTIIRDEM